MTDSVLAVYAAALVAILLVGNWPVDRFGRKPALWAVQVFMIVAAIIEMFATNWTHWLAAKLLNVSTRTCGNDKYKTAPD